MNKTVHLLMAILAIVSVGCSDPQPEVAEQSTQQLDPSIPIDSFPAFSNQTAEGLEAFFDSLSQRRQFNGVALFAHNDSLLCIRHGYKRLGGKDTIEFSDQFQLASLSKPFTAVALLRLIDQGKVGLTDPVEQYLIGFPYEGVTILQLLTHTSGLGYYAYVTDSIWGYPDLFMGNDDLLTMMLCQQVPTYYEPGRAFDYCNTNYALIPNIIEVVTGMPFSEYMRTELFEPIGMFDSEIMNTFHKDAVTYDVVGHYPNGKVKLPFYLDGVVGDKGMYSTAHDLYKFYLELKNGNLVSDSLMDIATAPHVKSSSDQYYGLGWRIRKLGDDDALVFHNGWWRGFRSYFWFSKRENKIAIILTNSVRGGYLKTPPIWQLF